MIIMVNVLVGNPKMQSVKGVFVLSVLLELLLFTDKFLIIMIAFFATAFVYNIRSW
jgi:hypothetical protein